MREVLELILLRVSQSTDIDQGELALASRLIIDSVCEGLKISRDLPTQINGLFHSGSVGIIMSGWLGAANYGVIVANEVDKFMRSLKDEPQQMVTVSV